jgi:hypothetical protein
MNVARAATVSRSRDGLCGVSVAGRLLRAAGPGGLVIGGLAVAGCMPLGSAAAATSPSRALVSRSKPVRAVLPPVRVGAVLQKTQRARFLVLTVASQTGPVTYVIDNVHGRAVTWTGRKVSLIQIGSKVYAPAPKSGCYLSAKRSSALLPNVAGMLLPSGIAALHYSSRGRMISWTIRAAGTYQPHGMVRVNAVGRIVSATIYSGPGVPLTATVSYPVKRPKIAAPVKVCRAGAKAHRAVAR